MFRRPAGTTDFAKAVEMGQVKINGAQFFQKQLTCQVKDVSTFEILTTILIVKNRVLNT